MKTATMTVKELLASQSISDLFAQEDGKIAAIEERKNLRLSGINATKVCRELESEMQALVSLKVKINAFCHSKKSDAENIRAAALSKLMKIDDVNRAIRLTKEDAGKEAAETLMNQFADAYFTEQLVYSAIDEINEEIRLYIVDFDKLLVEEEELAAEINKARALQKVSFAEADALAEKYELD